MTPLDSQIPDTVDLLLTIVSLLSLAVSVVALYKSNSAKKAVVKALDHRDAQDDLDRIVKLVSDLKAAQESVTPWIPGMSEKRWVGRDRNADLVALCDAVNSLRTNPPLEADEDLRGKIQESADRLDGLAESIGEDLENKNLWKLAQSELQKLIPILETAVRVTRKKLIGG